MRVNLISHCRFHVCMVHRINLISVNRLTPFVSDRSVLGSKCDSWYELKQAWCLDP